ncbi:hypothetical protein [Frankia sp. Cppng1_Ct_nod]|uniref:hypothetical protein n=1 Tax=Frankia sp. Cppng1_Ct_nod TaxID=2897162 RepID=UPI0013EF8636|nr:hypothetical protein [Frankia sp. Cppng1_Ct_nod]
MSALIWLAIVAVWGFVLIPMWLRHHDGTLEQRSAERFTTAMRVLSRRGTPRSDQESVPRPAAADPDEDIGRRAVPPSGRKREADRLALIRLRRQRLFVLLAAIPVTALLAGLLGGMWIFVQVLVDVGLFGYVVHLRRAAQSERRLRASRLARDRRIAAERAARHARRAPGLGALSGTGRQWADGSEPFRLSDPAMVDRDAGAAHGSVGEGHGVTTAETADLREIAEAAAAGTATAGGTRQPWVVDGVVVDGAVVDGAVVDGAVVDGRVADGLADNGTAVEGSAQAVADTDEFEDAANAEQGFGQGSGTPGNGRPATRSGARPNTSRPGRVQVNPPGTHGGLTAGPAASGSQQPEPRTEDPDDLDELLRRHAVGS